MPEEDYDFEELFELGSREPVAYIAGPCRHRRVVPVRSTQGEVVAGLCLNPECDQQLPTTMINAGIS